MPKKEQENVANDKENATSSDRAADENGRQSQESEGQGGKTFTDDLSGAILRLAAILAFAFLGPLGGIGVVLLMDYIDKKGEKAKCAYNPATQEFTTPDGQRQNLDDFAKENKMSTQHVQALRALTNVSPTDLEREARQLEDKGVCVKTDRDLTPQERALAEQALQSSHRFEHLEQEGRPNISIGHTDDIKSPVERRSWVQQQEKSQTRQR